MTYPKRSSWIVRYHGREGRPVVHQDERTSRLYIMVRAPKGRGVRRLYEGSTYLVEKKGGPTKVLRL